MNRKVVVAMSGGVDSSVAAALLIQQGYQVIGITMDIWPASQSAEEAERFGGCCSLAATEDARKVAFRLGIPHYVFNFRKVFKETVIKNFIHEYRRGRTPNPCIRCNQYVKFNILLHKAKAIGASYIATGHYARVEFDASKNRYILKKGVDLQKDQSYVLYVLTQEQLAHTLFPVGYLTKQKTREIATELGLPVATKRESQEICFIPDNNYPQFLKGYIPEAAKPGPILNKEGKVIGTHRGILFYTIGQRKGLNIASPEPLYVLAIDEERNALIVGHKEELLRKGLIASEVNFIAIDKLDKPLKIKAKIRYRAPEASAILSPVSNNRVKVEFEQPQKAIAPGQAVVFYKNNIVLGGGTIEASFNGF
jgi:tRNA-specific 2-thiouridylase